MQSNVINAEILGSTGTKYAISFSREGRFLNTSCTCPAGEMRTHCKHRLSLFQGDISRVFGDAPPNLAQRISEMVRGTDVEDALRAMFTAEAEVKTATLLFKRTKKALDRAMHK